MPFGRSIQIVGHLVAAAARALFRGFGGKEAGASVRGPEWSGPGDVRDSKPDPFGRPSHDGRRARVDRSDRRLPAATHGR